MDTYVGSCKRNTNALGCNKTKQVFTSSVENTVACHQTHTEDSTPEFPRSPEQRQVQFGSKVRRQRKGL